MCARTCIYFVLAISTWSVSPYLTQRSQTAPPLTALHNNSLFYEANIKGETLRETFTNTTFATRHGMVETERKGQISGAPKSGSGSAPPRRIEGQLAVGVTDLNVVGDSVVRQKRWCLFALFYDILHF